MREQSVARGLWAAAVVLAGAAALVAAWAIRAPHDRRAAAEVDDVARAVRQRSPEPQSLPLSAFEAVWDLKLQEPLFPSASAAKTAAFQPPPPPLGLKLIGTIIEPGRSLAMLSAANEKAELKCVGEEYGGAEILVIEQDRVMARYNGRSVTLELQQPDKPKG